MPSGAQFLSLIATCCCIAGFCCAQQGRDFESELISYLQNNITNYTPLTRPCLNPNQVVYIDVGIIVGQLISVDSAKQTVRISAFLQAGWNEERLVWSPNDFGGIRVVNWENSRIWFPVIFSYNGIGDNQILGAQIPVYLTSIQPNLTYVKALWRVDIEFSCPFDVSRFPFDQHVCELNFFFSDQGHLNTLVMPRIGKMQLDELGSYTPNSEWIMLNATSWAEKRMYKFLKNFPKIAAPSFVLRLEIKRVSIYYLCNVIVPLLLLILLQVLVYFVPVESGEKLGFGITIMLSYTVFLLLLDGIVPKSQTMPAIASFITAAMILSTISLLLTSIIMRFHFTPDGTKMPACVRLLFVSFLGRLFCVWGAANKSKTSPGPGADSCELSVRKVADGQDAPEKPVVASDWLLAAYALERLMVALGILATVIIISVYIIKPYA